MKTLVHFGAGNIGRSLVGQLFASAGWRVVFVDAYIPVVEALKSRGRYTVRIKDDLPPLAPDAVEVAGVTAIAAADADAVAAAVAGADLLGTSVGPANLPSILALVARGLARRTAPVSVLLCENLRNAATFAREELRRHLPEGFDLEGRVGLVETSIGKMVPRMPREVVERDVLEIWGEAYNRIVADRRGFVDEPPAIAGLVLKENFAAHVDRKLFVHNLGHATAAYHGFRSGRAHIWECMIDARIRAEVEGAMGESGRALVRRYRGEFTDADQRAHIDDLVQRFCNRALGDTVFRVGCDLARKLSPDDRCIGALKLCLEEGVEPTHIVETVAAAFLFRGVDAQGAAHPGDVAFLAAVAAHGVRATLAGHCGLGGPRYAPVVERIAVRSEELSRGDA